MFGPNGIQKKDAIESVLRDWGVDIELDLLIAWASRRYGKQLLKQPVVNARRAYMVKRGLTIYKNTDLIMSRRDAVYTALVEIGDATSLTELRDAASKHYGSVLPWYSVTQYRREYRIKLGLTTDCRTYESQPRRNMMKDNRLSVIQMKRRSVLSDKEKQLIKQFIGTGKHQFHSIPQLLHALR